jgi:BlaI family transcriptional regulator, penicillinase repressor
MYRNELIIMEKLTPQEEEAMLLIWEIGSCTVKDILEKYTPPKPPYTTLASVVKNLERKEFVNARKVGNTFEYTPCLTHEEYTKTFMSGVVKSYFSNSYQDLVMFFARDQKISSSELKEIIDMIEKGEEDKE